MRKLIMALTALIPSLALGAEPGHGGPRLEIESYRLPNGLKVALHRDSERAPGDGLRRLPRRLEERAGGPHGVRPLLRAHDVPGDEERPQLRHPAPGDRGPVQRVHVAKT